MKSNAFSQSDLSVRGNRCAVNWSKCTGKNQVLYFSRFPHVTRTSRLPRLHQLTYHHLSAGYSSLAEIGTNFHFLFFTHSGVSMIYFRCPYSSPLENQCGFAFNHFQATPKRRGTRPRRSDISWSSGSLPRHRAATTLILSLPSGSQEYLNL